MSGLSKALLLIGLLGVPAVLLIQLPFAVFDAKPRQAYALIPVMILAPLILLSVRFVTPRAFRRLRERPTILVPLGVVTVVVAAILRLWELPALAIITTPFLDANLLGVGFVISVMFLLYLAVWGFYGAWQTRLVIREVRVDRSDPGAALLEAPRWLLRTFLVMLIGHGVLMLLSLPIFALSALGSGAMILALFLIGVLAINWNFLTAGLLLVGLDERFGTLEALWTGFLSGLRNIRRWWFQVLAQMLLLGLATIVIVSFTTHDSDAGTRTVRSVSKTDWSVNGNWSGGYPTTTHWLEETMEAVEAEAPALAATVLALLLGLLAIAVKLHVADVLREEELDARYLRDMQSGP